MFLFHLSAVVLPPLAFQTRNQDGPSPLVRSVMPLFAGYGQFLHMDRGYAFFAPDPGPSHLIQAASLEPDGSFDEQMYPNLQNQWPRLLYHRHFMLTEFLNESYWPPGPPEELRQTEPDAAEVWTQRRKRYESIRQSYVDHLKSINGGREVYLRRIEHGLPTLGNYRAEPIPLDDPRLYNVLLDQPVESEVLPPTDIVPSADIVPSTGEGPTVTDETTTVPGEGSPSEVIPSPAQQQPGGGRDE